MKLQNKNAWYYIASLILASLYLTGCGGGDVKPASFEVTVVNATNNQPLSPVAVIVHNVGYSAWTVGDAASVELEQLAEGGSNTQLLAALPITATSESSAGAIGPGSQAKINITAGPVFKTYLSLVTMLVNTNDAFAGLRTVDVSGLGLGDSMVLTANVYDAGTEINNEASGTIPGPADGGEGFNADRSDNVNLVRGHGGVVSGADGLASSVLDQSHRFDNPAIVVTITRI